MARAAQCVTVITDRIPCGGLLFKFHHWRLGSRVCLHGAEGDAREYICLHCPTQIYLWDPNGNGIKACEGKGDEQEMAPGKIHTNWNEKLNPWHQFSSLTCRIPSQRQLIEIRWCIRALPTLSRGGASWQGPSLEQEATAGLRV